MTETGNLTVYARYRKDNYLFQRQGRYVFMPETGEIIVYVGHMRDNYLCQKQER